MTKLHPPLHLYLRDGVYTVTGYQSERPEPTEYLSAEMNKSDLNKWLTSKIELQVSEGSKDEIDNLAKEIWHKDDNPNIIWNKAKRLGIDISELHDRILVVKTNCGRCPYTDTHAESCKKGCVASEKFITLLPEKVESEYFIEVNEKGEIENTDFSNIPTGTYKLVKV